MGNTNCRVLFSPILQYVPAIVVLEGAGGDTGLPALFLQKQALFVTEAILSLSELHPASDEGNRSWEHVGGISS